MRICAALPFSFTSSHVYSRAPVACVRATTRAPFCIGSTVTSRPRSSSEEYVTEAPFVTTATCASLLAWEAKQAGDTNTGASDLKYTKPLCCPRRGEPSETRNLTEPSSAPSAESHCPSAQSSSQLSHSPSSVRSSASDTTRPSSSPSIWRSAVPVHTTCPNTLT